MKKVLGILLPVVLVLALAGAGVWWFALRDDAPDPAGLPDTTEQTTTTAEPGATTVAPSADGPWILEPGDQVFAGYRIQEQFFGQIAERTTVGRSPGLLGTLTVVGAQVTQAEVAVDMTQLRSDQARRDAQMKTSGLQTDTFPTATFQLTQPIDLPGPPQVGAVVEVLAAGQLTIHGVTNPFSLPLQVRWNGDTIDVAGAAAVLLADWGITPPSVAGFVTVADDAVFELQLQFVRRA
jgi:polyisoprenoid-binding protein YceI